MAPDVSVSAGLDSPPGTGGAVTAWQVVDCHPRVTVLFAACAPERMANRPFPSDASTAAALGPARRQLATRRRRHAGRLPSCADWPGNAQAPSPSPRSSEHAKAVGDGAAGRDRAERREAGGGVVAQVVKEVRAI